MIVRCRRMCAIRREPMTYQIRLDRVTVDFIVYDRGGRSLRDVLLLNPVRRVAARRARSVKAVGGMLSVDEAGYTVVRALDSIDLDIRDGDRVGLLGHNGSG